MVSPNNNETVCYGNSTLNIGIFSLFSNEIRLLIHSKKAFFAVLKLIEFELKVNINTKKNLCQYLFDLIYFSIIFYVINLVI